MGAISGDGADGVWVNTTTATAKATIAESDPITVSVSDPAEGVDEGDTATFTVSLSPSGVTPTADLTVDYATADGTATAGEDYTSKSGSLTFSSGSTEAQTVESTDDG